MDKGLRIMGRGDDGNAKAIKTDNEGKLDIKVQSLEEKINQLNNTIENLIDGDSLNTRLTGSIDEYALPVKPMKNFIVIKLFATDIAPNTDKVFDVYSEVGEIWTLKRFGYHTTRDTAATGGQAIWMYHGNSSTNQNFMISIEGQGNEFLRGTIPGRREPTYSGTTNPSNVFELVETIRDTTILSEELPIRIRYRNRSDKTISRIDFNLFFLVEEV